MRIIPPINAMMRNALAALAVIAAANAPAATIFNDNFDGAEGASPNASYWTSGGTVALTGDGSVGLSGAYSYLQALSSLAYAPTGDEFARLTFSNLSGASPNLSMQLELPAWTVVRIAVRNDLISSWVVDINPGEPGVNTYFDTNIDRNALGTWTLEWSATQVRAYHDGSLVFNSSVNDPTVGASWNIPTAALRPAFYESNGNGDATYIDGVVFESVPEPSTSILFGIACVCVFLIIRRRKQSQLSQAGR